jgi:hypothetical protein
MSDAAEWPAVVRVAGVDRKDDFPEVERLYLFAEVTLYLQLVKGLMESPIRVQRFQGRVTASLWWLSSRPSLLWLQSRLAVGFLQAVSGRFPSG